MRSITTLALVTAPLALLLAGCGATTGTPAAAPTTPAEAPTTSPARPEATPPVKVTHPAGTGGSGTGTARTPRCHTADLRVSVQPDPDGGAMGHHGEDLLFTNTSGHRCTLYGYPGVSWVAGDDGSQVNDAFQRSGGPKKTVTLTAGSVAHATIILVTAEAYDDADCHPAQVRGYRVYPPDETASVFVSAPQTACAAKGTGVGQVQPISSGTHD